MDILTETIALLKSRVGTISRHQIASDTELGYEWINKLAQGRIEDPGIKKVTKLHEYLKK